ncbi:MAG: ABC transporter permease [Rhodospirillaceae bacterium]|nr:ABC transporter permease [Rhodospirillaceae bacterium]MCY4311068.1 ABC transporter permease [Rhodospirillaceae bacterium]
MTDPKQDTGPAARAESAGWMELSEGGLLVVGGGWRLVHIPRLNRELERQPQNAGAIRQVDGSRLTALDSAGAQLLLQVAPAPDAIFGLADRFRGVLQRVIDAKDAIDRTPKPRPANGLLTRLEHIGRQTSDGGLKIYEMLGFVGLCVVTTGKILIRPWTLDLRATAHHLENTGLKALPIIGLLSFMIGVVVAFMGALQLRKFSAEIFTVDLIGVSVLRELGVMFAAIMVAGRSGSAFTAQIGTMQTNEEIDAMRAIGLDPIGVLVVPRVVALVIALPLLTIYANLVGLAGGAVISLAVLEISLTTFLEQLSGAVGLPTLMIGLSKAPIFAMAIAIIGCFEGFKVRGSAASVGRHTTTSVVESIFVVILIDAAFAMALSWMDI